MYIQYVTHSLRNCVSKSLDLSLHYMLQAEGRGASALMVGTIIGCTPLILAVFSPVFGYLVSANIHGYTQRLISDSGRGGGWLLKYRPHPP